MIDTPFKSVPLKDVIYFQEGPGLRNWQYGSSGVPFLNIRTITDEGAIDKSLCQYVKQDEFEGKYEHFLLEEGDYVVSSSGTLGKLAEIRAQDLPLMLNTSVIRFRPLNPEVLDRAYLKWFIKSPLYLRQIQKASTGTAIKNYGPSHLKQMVIPLPPLEEQRRIAAILDKADAVLRKRQEASALTEELLRSAFMEMFGDPDTNPKGWETITLSQFVQGEMRNGLSPSTSGTYKGQVLTLSAITQGRFNSAERKTAEFDVSPPKTKMVRKSNLLVCRGNGNINLVGCARFPDRDYDDIMFPDTIIAVPINFSIVHKTYLEILWNSPSIRRQIEQQARTTNGTHKINQKVLNDIQILLPPMALQEKFGGFCNAVKAVSARFADSAPNNLFNSLLQRVFRGEL